MKKYKLFTSIKVGAIELKNRIVMAPMTRCRAIDNIPNELMAKYYQQRATAGLIITEGTSLLPMVWAMPVFPVFLAKLKHSVGKR